MLYKVKARLSVKQSSFNRNLGWRMPSMDVFNALVDPKVVILSYCRVRELPHAQ